MIRYRVILEFLHFSDNSNHDLINPAGDKLFKIHPIMEYLVTKFQTPGKNILMDEELILPKGRLNFKQYIRNKRSGFGIKFFSLCEDCGYLWNTYVYAGKDAADEGFGLVEQLGKSGAVVPKLKSLSFSKIYHLYVVNCYTSKNFACHLFRKWNINVRYSNATKIKVFEVNVANEVEAWRI